MKEFFPTKPTTIEDLTFCTLLNLIFLIKKRMAWTSNNARLYLALILLLSITGISCAQEVERKADLNILVLGNSVLHHVPSEYLGWKGDWGMAATTAENDFAHILNEKLKQSHPNSVIYKTQNIAFWENDFNYNLDDFAFIKNIKADILIIRLGENVSDLKNYKAALSKIIDRYSKPDAQVIISGTVWDKLEVEAVHKDLAKKNNITFVSFAELRSDRKNFSRKLFENAAVGSHPSDKGMRAIADLLYEAVLNVEAKAAVTE